MDIAASPPILSDALFHCQQAVEKALQAMLAANEQQPFKTHDLEALAARSGRFMPHLGELIRKSYYLTTFASEFRYPGEEAEPGKEETLAGLEIASSIVTAIASELQNPH